MTERRKGFSSTHLAEVFRLLGGVFRGRSERQEQERYVPDARVRSVVDRWIDNRKLSGETEKMA